MVPLDIKIGVTRTSGIYHDKLGILEDFDGNTVVFADPPTKALADIKTIMKKF